MATFNSGDFRRRFSGVSAKDRFRLFFLLAASLVLIVIMISTLRIAQQKPPSTDSGTAVRHTGPEVYEGTDEPVRPPEPADPTYPSEGAPEGAVTDGTVWIEWKHVDHLLHRLVTKKEELDKQEPRLVTQRDFERPEAARELRDAWVYSTGTVAARAQPLLVGGDVHRSGIWTVYDSLIADRDGRLLRVWMTDKEREYEPEEAVRFRGFFFKINRYRPYGKSENLGQPVLVDVPLFIAYPFERLPPPERALAWLPIPIAVIVIVTGIALTLSVVIASRGDRKLREERLRRRIERRKSAGGGAAPPSPEAPPPSEAAGEPPEGW